jgi:hypothetical protein
LREPETCKHLFAHCPFTTAVWQQVRRWAEADFPIPGASFVDTADWWLCARKCAPKTHRRNFDTVAILVHWRIWKERNSRVFDNTGHSHREVFEAIRDDIRLWQSAGRVEAT